MLQNTILQSYSNITRNLVVRIHIVIDRSRPGNSDPYRAMFDFMNLYGILLYYRRLGYVTDCKRV